MFKYSNHPRFLAAASCKRSVPLIDVPCKTKKYLYDHGLPAIIRRLRYLFLACKSIKQNIWNSDNPRYLNYQVMQSEHCVCTCNRHRICSLRLNIKGILVPLLLTNFGRILYL